MSHIVKRKLRQTWREAVAARLFSAVPDECSAGLAAFDAALAAGQGEAEAAWAILSDRKLLWKVDAPGFAAAVPDRSDPHSVPGT